MPNGDDGVSVQLYRNWKEQVPRMVNSVTSTTITRYMHAVREDAFREVTGHRMRP